MYEVDAGDLVVRLDELPQPDQGAPVPALVADESRVAVAFIARLVGGSDAESVGVAVAEFVHPYAHTFGPPNDEAFDGHPLAARGLRPYGVFRIENSSWIRRLERMNAVHERHRADDFALLTHYVFSFHDSTFECVARDVNVTLHPADEPLTLEIEVAP